MWLDIRYIASSGRLGERGREREREGERGRDTKRKVLKMSFSLLLTMLGCKRHCNNTH